MFSKTYLCHQIICWSGRTEGIISILQKYTHNSVPNSHGKKFKCDSRWESQLKFVPHLEEALDNLIDPLLATYNCQYSDTAKSVCWLDLLITGAHCESRFCLNSRMDTDTVYLMPNSGCWEVALLALYLVPGSLVTKFQHAYLPPFFSDVEAGDWLLLKCKFLFLCHIFSSAVTEQSLSHVSQCPPNRLPQRMQCYHKSI